MSYFDISVLWARFFFSRINVTYGEGHSQQRYKRPFTGQLFLSVLNLSRDECRKSRIFIIQPNTPKIILEEMFGEMYKNGLLDP